MLADATTLQLNGTDWKVLATVLSLTATWSKFYDRTYSAIVAEKAHLDPKRARKTLRKLASLGLITYEPAKRNGEMSLIGFPTKLTIGDAPA